MKTDVSVDLDEPNRPFPIRIAPLTRLRITNLIGALVIAAAGCVGVWGGFAVGLTTHSGWAIVGISAPFAAYGLVVLPGTQRLGVVLQADQAIVRGFFGSQRILRASVRGVTDYPSIIWTDGRGRIRSTPINALNIYKSGWAEPNPAIVAENDRLISLIESWARKPTG